MAAAGIDYAFGNKIGLGIKYRQAFSAMGTLAMYMAGALCIAPALGKILYPLINPLYLFFGSDPSMFAGTVLGSDTGAYTLAFSLTKDNQAANFSGLILGSMLGITISFLIPFLLSSADKNSRPLVAKGILAGIITIPFGCIAGGTVAGFGILFMLKNLVPAMLFSTAVAAGLIFAQNATVKIFLFLGKIVGAFLSLSLVIAAIEATTGFALIKGMYPIKDAFAVIGAIVIILAGALSLVHILTKIFAKTFEKAGSKLKINDKSAAGFFAALANTVAMAALFNDMDDRGKILNSAFAVSAGFALGDHLGFTASVDKDMILAVLCGKLTGGITALILTCIIFSKTKAEDGKPRS